MNAKPKSDDYTATVVQLRQPKSADMTYEKFKLSNEPLWSWPTSGLTYGGLGGLGVADVYSAYADAIRERSAPKRAKKSEEDRTMSDPISRDELQAELRAIRAESDAKFERIIGEVRVANAEVTGAIGTLRSDLEGDLGTFKADVIGKLSLVEAKAAGKLTVWGDGWHHCRCLGRDAHRVDPDSTGGCSVGSTGSGSDALGRDTSPRGGGSDTTA